MSGDFTQIMRTEHLPTRIATQFSRQIQKGALKPGDKLPTELAMSKSFGVSRTVIREAIAQLRNTSIALGHMQVVAPVDGVITPTRALPLPLTEDH